MGIFTKRRQGFRVPEGLKYSEFYNTHPAIQVMYFMTCIAFCFIFNNPVYTMLGFLSFACLSMIYEWPRKIMRSMRFYMILAVVILVFSALTNHRGRHKLFFLSGKPVTAEVIAYSLISAVTIITVLMIFIVFNKIITQDRFLFIFSRISPKISFILMMGLRWVPMLTGISKDINMIQKAKNVNYEGNAEKRRIKNKLNVFKRLAVNLEILLQYSMESAMTTALSMKARGYEANGRKRTFYFNYKLIKRDFCILFIILLLSAANIAFLLNGRGKVDIYRDFSYASLTFFDPLAFLSYALLCIMPLLLEIKGSCRNVMFSTNRKKKRDKKYGTIK